MRSMKREEEEEESGKEDRVEGGKEDGVIDGISDEEMAVVIFSFAANQGAARYRGSTPSLPSRTGVESEPHVERLEDGEAWQAVQRPPARRRTAEASNDSNAAKMTEAEQLAGGASTTMGTGTTNNTESLKRAREEEGRSGAGVESPLGESDEEQTGTEDDRHAPRAPPMQQTWMSRQT